MTKNSTCDNDYLLISLVNDVYSQHIAVGCLLRIHRWRRHHTSSVGVATTTDLTVRSVLMPLLRTVDNSSCFNTSNSHLDLSAKRRPISDEVTAGVTEPNGR